MEQFSRGNDLRADRRQHRCDRVGVRLCSWRGPTTNRGDVSHGVAAAGRHPLRRSGRTRRACAPTESATSGESDTPKADRSGCSRPGRLIADRQAVWSNANDIRLVAESDHSRLVRRRRRCNDDPIDCRAVERELLLDRGCRRHHLHVCERAALVERLDPAWVREVHRAHNHGTSRWKAELSPCRNVDPDEAAVGADDDVRAVVALLVRRERRPCRRTPGPRCRSRKATGSACTQDHRRSAAAGRSPGRSRNRDPEDPRTLATSRTTPVQTLFASCRSERVIPSCR